MNWSKFFSFRTGVTVFLSSLLFYAGGLVTLKLHLDAATQGTLWLILWGVGKFLQVTGIAILAVWCFNRFWKQWKGRQH